MGETENTSKAPKENWFAGLKAEFKMEAKVSYGRGTLVCGAYLFRI